MQQLRKAIGDPPVLAICSNACKGLTSAVNDVFPNAEKRECFRHLMQNYIKHFTGSEHMYLAAKAYRNTIFEHHFSNARDILGVKQWIDEWHPLYGTDVVSTRL